MHIGEWERGRRERERTNTRMFHTPADGTIGVINVDSQWKCCIQSKNCSLSRSERTNRTVQTLSRNIFDDQINICGSAEQKPNIILLRILSLTHYSAELPLRAELIRAS